MTLPWYAYLFSGLAAVAAGMVNALAGGGTLITFPVLTSLGLSGVVANITNTVALCPGYLGGVYAQRADLLKHKQRLWSYLPAGALGGIAGGVLLLNTGERLFNQIIPFLILLASALLAASDPLRGWMTRRMGQGAAAAASLAALGVPAVALAAVYGGYFGAGLSVIVLAALGLFLNDSLTQLNALKQAISFAVNVAAAIFFVFSGNVVWPVAAVMAVCALAGGWIGGKLAGRIKAAQLRWVVVCIGTLVSLYYFYKVFLA